MNNNDEIYNSQNTSLPIPVSAPVEYAGFWIRAVAAMIDGFILYLFLILTSSLDYVTAFIINSIITFTYTTVFECSDLKGTPGKALVGIALVMDEDQSTLTFKTSLVRYLCKFVSGIMLFIGYFMQVFTEKRQTLHDILAKTIVVKNKKSGDINYFTAFKNSFNKIVS